MHRRWPALILTGILPLLACSPGSAPQEGLTVESLGPSGAGARSGLQVGDVLLSWRRAPASRALARPCRRLRRLRRGAAAPGSLRRAGAGRRAPPRRRLGALRGERVGARAGTPPAGVAPRRSRTGRDARRRAPGDRRLGKVLCSGRRGRRLARRRSERTVAALRPRRSAGGVRLPRAAGRDAAGVHARRRPSLHLDEPAHQHRPRRLPRHREAAAAEGRRLLLDRGGRQRGGGAEVPRAMSLFPRGAAKRKSPGASLGQSTSSSTGTRTRLTTTTNEPYVSPPSSNRQTFKSTRRRIADRFPKILKPALKLPQKTSK